MMRTFDSFRSKQIPAGERGQAIVLLVLLITGLMAVAALAVDGGRLYSERRFVQNTSDNAALAGALAICNDEDVVAAAQASVSANAGGELMDVVVNQPPLSGPNAGDNTYVEVIISSAQQPFFAQLVYSGKLEATARAVGHCFTGGGPVGGGNVVLVLDADDSCSFSATGNATLFLTLGEGGIYANSSDPDNAICADGNASVDTDTGVFVVGGYDENGNAEFLPPPVTGVAPIPDPLAALAAPTKPGGSCVAYSQNSGSATIDPGLYCSITVTSNASLTMNPGEYYIETGDFSVSGNADLDATEVLVYLEQGNFTMSGGGDFNFSAPSSGPYQGLMLFMDQANVSTITISGNSVVNTSGTIYGALSAMALSGNGSGTVLNGQVIVNTLAISGNAAMTLNYDADLVFGGPGGANFIELSE
jgi:Flp pilus assembly protein TadG